MNAPRYLKENGERRTSPAFSLSQVLSDARVDAEAPVWIALEDGTTLSILSAYHADGVVWIDAEEVQ